MKNLKALKLVLIMAVFYLPVNAKKMSGNNIGIIVNTYLDIKNALVNGDGTTAKIKANDLYRILAAHPDKGLTHAQRLIMADHLGDMVDACSDIGESIDVEKQRESFKALSANLAAFLKGIKLNTKTLYEQYCPMKKASWLSESPAIKNPYYGDAMLTCGKVTATLNGKGK